LLRVAIVATLVADKLGGEYGLTSILRGFGESRRQLCHWNQSAKVLQRGFTSRINHAIYDDKYPGSSAAHHPVAAAVPVPSSRSAVKCYRSGPDRTTETLRFMLIFS